MYNLLTVSRACAKSGIGHGRIKFEGRGTSQGKQLEHCGQHNKSAPSWKVEEMG